MVLTPCVQAMLLLSAAPSHPGAAAIRSFVILALVIPIACYIWALRDAPIVPRHSRRLVRIAVLVLIATGLSLAGYILGLEMITRHAALN